MNKTQRHTLRKRSDRIETAKALIEAGVRHCNAHGTPIICRGKLNNARPILARIGNAEIIFLPKAVRLTGYPPHFLLDIYVDGLGKVFSAWFHPVDVVSFKRGQWIPDLMNAIARDDQSGTAGEGRTL